MTCIGERPAATGMTVLATMLRASVALAMLGTVALLPGRAQANAYYAIDEANSSVQVRVYRGGLLGKLGHNHVVSLTALHGCVERRQPIQASRLIVRFDVADLQVDDAELRRAAGADFAAEVSADDIRGTRRNMLGPKLLDADRYPEIRIYAYEMTGQLPQLLLNSFVQLLGQDVALELPLQVAGGDDFLEVSGERRLSHDELGLRPFRAAFGVLRVAQTMQLHYRLRARRLAAASTEASDCERALAVIDDYRTAFLDEASE